MTATVTSPATTVRPSVRTSVLRRLPVVQLVVLAAVFAWGTIQMDGFASPSSLKAMSVIACLLALASLGQTLVIIIGGLDLAIPGYITVGAVATVVLGGTHGWPLWLVALFVVAVCGAAGALSGAICHYLKVQSLVVTLGMSAVLTGGVLIATKANILGMPPASLGSWTAVMGRTFGLPFPPVVALTVLAVVGTWLFLAHTPAGRRLYATGANPRAAEGLGVRTARVWIGTFAFGAACTGLTGMLIAGFTFGASLSTGDPYFYSGLAAVLVGGTALGTAQGDFLRTVLGALTLTGLTTILAGLGLGEGDTRILYGIAIILVVLAYGRGRRLRDRL
ncbi:ABC transporter permease [Georgenia thermotolerans]|uniref:ABC transporter permease n=1 Tax=Georgenia thermotolerans TaxID=527326 RepID=A0A7J5USF2_9MICO|nr:ABC transporter permease [Georgenia thermotolerans]